MADGANGLGGDSVRKRAAPDVAVVQGHVTTLLLHLEEGTALFKVERMKKSAMHSLAQVHKEKHH